MHAFFVPSLALQTYSFSGRINEIWTEIPMGEKTYYGQCNQICGVNHAYMPIVVKVVSKELYQKWLESAILEFAGEPKAIQLASNK